MAFFELGQTFEKLSTGSESDGVEEVEEVEVIGEVEEAEEKEKVEEVEEAKEEWEGKTYNSLAFP